MCDHRQNTLTWNILRFASAFWNSAPAAKASSTIKISRLLEVRLQQTSRTYIPLLYPFCGIINIPFASGEINNLNQSSRWFLLVVILKWHHSSKYFPCSHFFH
jgi:hypothetical protein